MKKHEITFSIIKVPLDFMTVVMSFFIAKKLREVTDLIPGIDFPTQTISSSALLDFAIFGGCLCISVFAIHGLYSIKISHSKLKEFLDIIWYSIYFFMFFALFVYLGNGIAYSEEIPRLIILFATIIAASGIMVQRLCINFLQSFLISRGTIKKRNLLIISNKKQEKSTALLHDIQQAKIYKVIGYINQKKIQGQKMPYLGGVKDFLKLLRAGDVDEILLVESDFSKKELYEIWDESRIFGIRYRYVTNYFDITSANTTLSLINSIPVIEIKNTPLENWGRVWKRIFDMFLSCIFFVIAFPIMCFIALAIKIEEPKAPIIFKNKRVGLKGNTFFLYKFRYLKQKYCTDEGDQAALAFEEKLIKERSERDGPLYKIKNDPRKTKVGKIIEKYSLDELPQLLNVIRGDMSLVGPRPHQPREVKKYKISQKRVLTIKPGITGMGQINGRDKNTFDKEVKLDIFYIENWSLLLDLKIILKTFPILFQRK